MKKLLATVLFLSLFATIIGCEDSNNPFEGSSDGDSDSDSDSDGDSDADSDSDGDSDADTDTGTGDPICDELNFDIEITPVRMVPLLDISGSMSGTKIADAKTAINDILTTWGGAQIQFGFDYYPNNGSSGVNTTIPIAPAAGTESAITTMVNGLSAYGGTPTYEAMSNYTNASYATGFPEAGVECYLILITDGVPNNGTVATYTTLTTTLLTSGIKTIAIGYNYTSSTLNAVAASGGMPAPYDTPILATDLTTLQAAFNSIAGAVVNCIYDIDITNDVDFDEVNFFFIDDLGNETVVPYDEDCLAGQGWHWVDDTTHDQVEFCDDACDELKNGDVDDIRGEFGCPQVIVD